MVIFVYKYFKYIIVALIPLISFYFPNKYLFLYLSLTYLFLTNLKPYYTFGLLFIYFIKPEAFIPSLCLILLLQVIYLFKKKYISLLYSLILFIIFNAYIIKEAKTILLISSILILFTLGLYFYFKTNMALDFYLNKLLITFLSSIYLYFSSNAHLGYAFLIISYQNKRDLTMLFFVVTGAIFNNYTKIPFYLFFLALALKSFSLNIIFTLISIYLFKTQYLYYIPIALNFLLYNQNDKPIYLSYVINNVNKYLKLIENKSNNMDSYDTIDERIKALLKSYCLNCPMKEKCFSKRRIDMYHFLMYEVTSNMKHSKEIDYFIYNCEYKKMMDEAPKINFNLNSSYNTIKDTINILISENNLKNDLIAKLKNYSLSSINYINDSQMTLSFNEYILPLKLERILKNRNLNISYTGNNTYEIAYKSKCKIKAESIILSKGGGYIAGDNCLIKKTSTKLYAALSDGMGSGLKAYEASKALLKRLEGLINLPYDDEKIIRLLTELSHISLFTSSYATLDFFSANLATKKGKLFKIASSTSLLIRNNQIKEFNTKTLPIDFDGILDLYEIDLEKNDIILLMSDGVFDFSNIKALYSYILSISYLEPDKLVYNIAKYIFNESNKKLHDDTSILAIKVY